MLIYFSFIQDDLNSIFKTLALILLSFPLYLSFQISSPSLVVLVIENLLFLFEFLSCRFDFKDRFYVVWHILAHRMQVINNISIEMYFHFAEQSNFHV